MHVEKQIYIAYDSTNMNSAAGNLELAEYGHAKDRDGLPQVNLSIGYNHTLFSVENFDDNAIGRLFKEIKVKDIDLFIDAGK